MTKELLDERLQNIYRGWVYVFGLFMAFALVGGSWYGIQMVQKHDQAHRQTQKIQQINKSNQGKRVANPYLDAKTVHFEFPYRHGADPYSITHVMALQQHQKKAIQGGFVLDGLYRSGNIEQKVELKLACETVLCKLSFDLPANFILPPRFDGKRMRRPERNFSLIAHDYEFQVQHSQLRAIRALDSDKWALFDGLDELKHLSKEVYLTADNRPIKKHGT